MCLYTKRKKWKIAGKDIVCYKWVYKTDDGKYLTPFLFANIGNEIINGKEPFVALGELEICDSEWFRKGRYKFGKGCIHTYANFKTAKKVYGLNWACSQRITMKNEKTQIFKCVIKKGTPYIKGHDGCGVTCYASTEIHFVEQVNTEEYV